MNHPANFSAIIDPSDKPKILVVDDQNLNIQILFKILKNEYQVFKANDAVEALKVVETNRPDLILLDVIMPNIGGLEFCAQLKKLEEFSEIPVIFVTSQDQPDEEAAGFAAGGVDFVTKPVNAVVVLARVKTHITLKKQNDMLFAMAYTDSLTGLVNRRWFDHHLDQEWKRNLRRVEPIAVFMIDFDFFKLFNDTYGHLAGDDCLRTIAAAIKACLKRSSDVLARYGGEEFIAMFPSMPLASARAKGQEIVETVRALAIPHASSMVAKVATVSLGIAWVMPSPTKTVAQVVEAADQQLYVAKSSGRDQYSLIEV